MGAASQNLKATITFAGGVDSSWKRSTKDVEKSLKDVDKESQKLIRDQAKLAAEIKKAKLAGRNVADLSRQYREVSQEIRRTEHEQQRLNRQMSRAKRFERFMGVGRGVMQRAGGMTGSVARWGAAGITGGLTAATLSPILLADEAANRKAQADKLGVSIPEYMAQEVFGNAIGLTADSFSDIKNQYLKHEGAFRTKGKDRGFEQTAKTIELKDHELKGMDSQQRYEYILDALTRVSDQAKRTSAAMALLGPEGGKLVETLRASGRSYREQVDEQQKYSSLTNEGAAGAAALNDAMFKLKTAFLSGMMEVSGKLGDELAPKIDDAAKELGEWFKGGGITRIKDFFLDDLYPKLQTFGEGVAFIGRVIYALAKKLSWLLPDERDDRRGVLKSLAMTGSTDIARMTAKNSGQEEWFDKLLRENPDAAASIKKSYVDTRGYFKDDDDTFNNILDKYLGPKSTGKIPSFDEILKGNNWKAFVRDPANQNGDTSRKLTDNRKFDYHFIINGAPGQDASAIGDAVMGITKTSPAFTGDNALFDSWSD